MLGKNKNKTQNTVTAGSMLNIIGKGTKITGDLFSEGDLRVDGIIEGNVNVQQRLVLGLEGLISGDIKANDGTISGTLEGNVSIKETLNLNASCLINGDIVTNKLIIESGARFNGKCSMKTTEHTTPNTNAES